MQAIRFCLKATVLEQSARKTGLPIVIPSCSFVVTTHFGFEMRLAGKFIPDFAKTRLANVIPLRGFVFLVVAFLCVSGCAGEPKHPNWKNATGAEQYEWLMWKAMRDKNWKEVEYHLAPTFVGVTDAGQTVDRDGWVEYWKAAAIGEFSLGEVSVQPSGTDMTVVYVLHLSGNKNQAFRMVSVWQEIKRGWLLIAASTTPIRS